LKKNMYDSCREYEPHRARAVLVGGVAGTVRGLQVRGYDVRAVADGARAIVERRRSVPI
jgi:hypothetical protein